MRGTASQDWGFGQGVPMDEAAAAFAPPHVRAAIRGDGPLPDRISLRDYVREVEIGAFSAERGVRQRLRFNIVLEVVYGAGGCEDDVDKVLSYDTITDAVEAALAVERVNLLETLAERVAALCLADRRAIRAFVRVEKLERVPGALGVEIVRSRSAGLPRIGIAPAGAGRPMAATAPAPIVLHLPAPVLDGPQGGDWRDAAAASARPVLVLPDPMTPQERAGDEAALRIGLLAIEQAAWRLAGIDPRFTVVASRTEIAWALRGGGPLVLAPGKLVLDAPQRPDVDAGDPRRLARWLAAEIGAAEVVLVDAADGEAGGISERRLDPRSPQSLARSD
jgi:dihydroneopterin aldolase